MLNAVLIARLDCDVCGKVANLDGEGGGWGDGWAATFLGGIPAGWRVQTLGKATDPDGEWLTADEALGGDLYFGGETLGLCAVCPDCDPVKLCNREDLEYRPEDWEEPEK